MTRFVFANSPRSQSILVDRGKPTCLLPPVLPHLIEKRFFRDGTSFSPFQIALFIFFIVESMKSGVVACYLGDG